MGKNHNERWTNDMHTGCYLDTDQSAQMHIHVDLLKSWGASAKSVATLLDLDSMSVVHKMSVFSAEQNKNKFKNPFLVGNVVFELSCDVFFLPTTMQGPNPKTPCRWPRGPQFLRPFGSLIPSAPSLLANRLMHGAMPRLLICLGSALGR